VLGIELRLRASHLLSIELRLRASHLLSMHSTTDIHPQPYTDISDSNSALQDFNLKPFYITSGFSSIPRSLLLRTQSGRIRIFRIYSVVLFRI
jgi:hypothetical protein